MFESVVAEIDALLARAGLAPGNELHLAEYGQVPGKSDTEVTALGTSFSAAITRLAPSGSPYLSVAGRYVQDYGAGSGYALVGLVGVLNGLRSDYGRWTYANNRRTDPRQRLCRLP